MNYLNVNITIDNELLDWVKKKIKTKEFSNKSAALRKCIMISKRVYENGTPEEVMKFVHGKE